MKGDYKVFAINPGSTSTKIALICGSNAIFSKNVSHSANKLAEFSNISEQLPFRKETILSILKENNVLLDGIDACVGRGGGLASLEGGTYEVDELVLEHAKLGYNGVQHPAQLGTQLANEFAKEYGCTAYTVNPPSVDEYQDLARMTGIKGVFRQSRIHSLNQKEIAIRHSKIIGKKYEECNYIVCHIGGGISIVAHSKGKMIDGNDIVGGEGPMAPTRCGSIPATDIIDMSYAHGKTYDEMKILTMQSGGIFSHLGTSDTIEVSKNARDGDKYARMVWDTMIYQITKYIGEMAVVLHGNINGILLSGGMVYNDYLVEKIKKACSFIAPITSYPGEFEMEGMAAGAIRVLSGIEKVKKYTGIPIWEGFDFLAHNSVY